MLGYKGHPDHRRHSYWDKATAAPSYLCLAPCFPSIFFSKEIRNSWREHILCLQTEPLKNHATHGPQPASASPVLALKTCTTTPAGVRISTTKSSSFQGMTGTSSNVLGCTDLALGNSAFGSWFCMHCSSTSPRAFCLFENVLSVSVRNPRVPGQGAVFTIRIKMALTR